MMAESKVIEKLTQIEHEIAQLKREILEGEHADVEDRKKAAEYILSQELDFHSWEEEKRKLIETRVRDIGSSGH